MPAEVLVDVQGVTVTANGNTLLDNVSLQVPAGAIVTVVGPNGAGKTTLLKSVLGLVRPQAGVVWRQPGLRVGYVPQRLSVDPSLPLTVRRFLALALRRGGNGEVAAALAAVKAAHVLDRQVHDISGGELQRVMLARAALRRPELLVLDEPVGNVDMVGQAELYAAIARLRDDTGCAVLMVSHDLHLVMAATDQVICLNHHVCCAGSPQVVSRDPAYAALFGTPAAANLAVYTHHHDHRHGPDGCVATEAEPRHG